MYACIYIHDYIAGEAEQRGQEGKLPPPQKNFPACTI